MPQTLTLTLFADADADAVAATATATATDAATGASVYPTAAMLHAIKSCAA